jgi:two-component system, OmpR family, KDP operon response regulator KdpE
LLLIWPSSNRFAFRGKDVVVKVLIISEENRLTKDTSFSLQIGYPDCAIVNAENGAQGLSLVESDVPDLTIMSSSLPDTDVFKLTSQIRRFSNVPLLVLIEGENEIDRAMVLEAGADDYIARPINPIELIARIHALLRRTNGHDSRQENIFSAGKLAVNFSRREVSVSNNPVKLTPHEYGLLEKLIKNEGRVVTNRVLLETVWGPDYVADNTFIKKYVYRLRTKLEDNPANPSLLLCERGIGYKFVKPTG